MSEVSFALTKTGIQITPQTGQSLLTFWIKHFVFNKAENFMILT